MNIPRVSIAVEKGGRRTGEKRDRGVGAYRNLIVDAFTALANGNSMTLLGPSKICHFVSLPGVLSKTLMVGPPYWWVTSMRYPVGVRS